MVMFGFTIKKAIPAKQNDAIIFAVIVSVKDGINTKNSGFRLIAKKRSRSHEGT